MAKIYRINAHDNVAVALEKITKGTTVTAGGVTVKTNAVIPAGHKVALKAIPLGQEILKYGFPIGVAKVAIKAGDWVHTHNVKSRLGKLLAYKYEPVKHKTATNPRNVPSKVICAKTAG
jgi:altronate hydrolase